jgi:hypothetical protein
MNGAHNLTSVRISRTRNGLTGRRHMSPRPRRATRKSCAKSGKSCTCLAGTIWLRKHAAHSTLNFYLEKLYALAPRHQHRTCLNSELRHGHTRHDSVDDTDITPHTEGHVRNSCTCCMPLRAGVSRQG